MNKWKQKFFLVQNFPDSLLATVIYFGEIVISYGWTIILFVVAVIRVGGAAIPTGGEVISFTE